MGRQEISTGISYFTHEDAAGTLRMLEDTDIFPLNLLQLKEKINSKRKRSLSVLDTGDGIHCNSTI